MLPIFLPVAAAFAVIILLGMVAASVADKVRINRLARKASQGGSL